MSFEIQYTASVVDGAYHGTDLLTGSTILKSGFQVSKHTRYKEQYFGDGVYFWESSFAEAKAWAKRKASYGIAVIRATIHLKRCLDLNKEEHIEFITDAQKTLERAIKENIALGTVINFMHDKGICTFDTIRGGISTRSSRTNRWKSVTLPEILMILCVRDTSCIVEKKMAYQGSI